MNEIEKLYETAGIEKEKKQQCVKSYKTENGIGICIDFSKRDDYLYCYPPFTAEKQLNLIKWLLFSKWWMSLKCCQFAPKFDERLAELISDIWQDLTKTEQEEIRKILKG